MRILLTLLLAIIFTAAFAATGTTVSYTIKGEEFEGYYISSGPNAPLVFLVHDWDGLTEYEINRARMLAEHGYSVFCADMYGKGVRPTENEEKKKLARGLYADRSRMRALLSGALAAAKAQGAHLENAVAMGYWFGGTVVRELARSGVEMKGFVIFRGGLVLPEEQDYPETRVQILIRHGSPDSGSIMDGFAEMPVSLESAEVQHAMLTYGGAPHVPTVYGSPGYQEEADKKGWERFIAFLAVILKQQDKKEQGSRSPLVLSFQTQ
ncbi:MAG: dienelactone hydrolase family protein [Proteobacteria bacterium]|nr:dienelactone hydrolase family protein [Pseudomonadota bacterium]MBU1137920.1 dienelactone hydrolase family protein [Pseudomonadota bacterium]